MINSLIAPGGFLIEEARRCESMTNIDTLFEGPKGTLESIWRASAVEDKGGNFHVVSPDRCTDRCIAGPIHDRYMRIFFVISVYFWGIWMASPIRTDIRLCSDTCKIQQNTAKYIWGNTYPRFGGNRTQAHLCKSARR